MQSKKLGHSDLSITRLGLGAWAIGGQWAWGWGSQQDELSIRTIHRALDQGINWIDTAPVYGLGHSEEVIAQALESATNRPYIFTKCGLVWDANRAISNNLRKESVHEEINASLKRLRIEVIDLLQIHWPNPDEHIEDAWEAMAEAQKHGKVRYLGVSNFSIDQIERVQKIAPVTSLQPHYNLINRGVEEAILPYCLDNGIGVINYSPMGSGLLTGKMSKESIQALPDDDWRKDPSKGGHFAEPQLSKNLGLVEILRDIGTTYGKTAGEVAIAWTLTNPAVTAAIVGLRKPEQVDGILGGDSIELSAGDLKRIEDYSQSL